MNKPAGSLRASANAHYRVRIAPVPTVIDAGGVPVDDARVLEISFPGESTNTPLGPVNVIVGAGIAKILVDDITIRGVPLC